jgi:hypothetical protein
MMHTHTPRHTRPQHQQKQLLPNHPFTRGALPAVAQDIGQFTHRGQTLPTYFQTFLIYRCLMTADSRWYPRSTDEYVCLQRVKSPLRESGRDGLILDTSSAVGVRERMFLARSPHSWWRGLSYIGIRFGRVGRAEGEIGRLCGVDGTQLLRAILRPILW